MSLTSWSYKTAYDTAALTYAQWRRKRHTGAKKSSRRGPDHKPMESS